MATFTLSEFQGRFNGTEHAFQNRFEIIMSPPAGVEARVPSLRCETFQFPARNLRTAADDNIYGPPREVVQGVGQFATINATFYCDINMSEKIFFEQWQQLIYDKNTYNLNYYTEYTGIIDVYQLSRGESENQTYGIKLFEVYPKTISAQDLNTGTSEIQKIGVEFAYRYWERLDNISNSSGDAFERALLRNIPASPS